MRQVGGSNDLLPLLTADVDKSQPVDAPRAITKIIFRAEVLPNLDQKPTLGMLHAEIRGAEWAATTKSVDRKGGNKVNGTAKAVAGRSRHAHPLMGADTEVVKRVEQVTVVVDIASKPPIGIKEILTVDNLGLGHELYQDRISSQESEEARGRVSLHEIAQVRFMDVAETSVLQGQLNLLVCRVIRDAKIGLNSAQLRRIAPFGVIGGREVVLVHSMQSETNCASDVVGSVTNKIVQEPQGVESNEPTRLFKRIVTKEIAECPASLREGKLGGKGKILGDEKEDFVWHLVERGGRLGANGFTLVFALPLAFALALLIGLRLKRDFGAKEKLHTFDAVNEDRKVLE